MREKKNTPILSRDKIEHGGGSKHHWQAHQLRKIAGFYSMSLSIKLSHFDNYGLHLAQYLTSGNSPFTSKNKFIYLQTHDKQDVSTAIYGTKSWENHGRNRSHLNSENEASRLKFPLQSWDKQTGYIPASQMSHTDNIIQLPICIQRCTNRSWFCKMGACLIVCTYRNRLTGKSMDETN